MTDRSASLNQRLFDIPEVLTKGEVMAKLTKEAAAGVSGKGNGGRSATSPLWSPMEAKDAACRSAIKVIARAQSRAGQHGAPRAGLPLVELSRQCRTQGRSARHRTRALSRAWTRPCRAARGLSRTVPGFGRVTTFAYDAMNWLTKVLNAAILSRAAPAAGVHA